MTPLMHHVLQCTCSFFPRLSFQRVRSVRTCVLPYSYTSRKTLRMLFQLTMLCELMWGRGAAGTSPIRSCLAPPRRTRSTKAAPSPSSTSSRPSVRKRLQERYGS